LCEEAYDGLASDIWAIGMTLLYAACGRSMFRVYTNASVQMRIAALLAGAPDWPTYKNFIGVQNCMPVGYSGSVPWSKLQILERAWLLTGRSYDDMPKWFSSEADNTHFHRMLHMDPSKRRCHIALELDDDSVNVESFEIRTPMLASVRNLMYLGLYDYRANKYAATWLLFAELATEVVHEDTDINLIAACVLLAALRTSDLSIVQDYGHHVKPKLLELGHVGTTTCSFEIVRNMISLQSKYPLNGPMMKKYGLIRSFRVKIWRDTIRRLFDVSRAFTLFEDVSPHE
jgi:serine/threonine protein kinase